MKPVRLGVTGSSPVAGWQAVANAAARRISPRLGKHHVSLRPLEDAELVSRAQAGDRGAFEVLVARHDDRLYAVVLRLSGNAHEAEEIVQETFLRAWRNLDQFEGRAQFFTWLFRIGVNEAKRRLEHQRARGMTGSLDEAGVEVADWREVPERRAEQHDLERALEHAIATLPPDHRLPLILRDIEGLSTAEAAAIMDLGEAAFKSRLHRARMNVRAAVADYALGDDE